MTFFNPLVELMYKVTKWGTIKSPWDSFPAAYYVPIRGTVEKVYSPRISPTVDIVSESEHPWILCPNRPTREYCVRIGPPVDTVSDSTHPWILCPNRSTRGYCVRIDPPVNTVSESTRLWIPLKVDLCMADDLLDLNILVGALRRLGWIN